MNTLLTKNVWRMFYASIAFSYAVSVQAASFDCAKASSKVEHIICDTLEISKLDDELNTAYKTALKDEKQADSIKQAQKQWMKERNSCADAGCVNRAYEARLSTLAGAHATTGDGVATTPVAATPKLRYAFCDKSKPALYCEGQTGKGYTVCEAYLAYLTSLTEPPTCEAPVPPGFKQPEWEEMDVTQHLDLAYQAEGIFLKKFGGYKHPEFDAWKTTFLQEIKEGKVNPRMRKAKVTPNDKGDATILAYTRDRDSCLKSYGSEERRNANYDTLPGLFWQHQGDVHFILPDNTPSTLQVIVGDASRWQTDLMLYAGRPYLVQIERPFDPLTKYRDIKTIIPRDRSPITVYAFDPRFPDRVRLQLDLNHYLADKLCQFKPYF